MTELSGMLDGLGLTAIVRFLSGLHKSGCLRLSQDGWHGEILFDNGRLADAAFGSRSGLPALDALVEVLPAASFTFDSQVVPRGEPTIHLQGASLLAHLDEIAARMASGQRSLPAVDAVPSPTTGDNRAEEPVQFDRGTLQTLLAVDGHRTVREIVALRRSMDALWQLGTLLNADLIELRAPRPAVQRAPALQAPVVGELRAPPPVIAQPATLAALPEVATAAAAEVAGAPEPSATSTALQCPKLGLEDDAASAFGAPTRLHRCFAVGRPLPLSLDQQRDLCLSDQYSTCPRLAGTLPLREVPSNFAPESRRLRRASPTASPNGQTIAAPTPLRARLSRNAPATVEAPSVATAADPTAEPPAPARPRESALDAASRAEAGVQQRRSHSPRRMVIPVIGVIVLGLAAVLYMVPRNVLFGDNTIDPATSPSASLVHAGTPVADLDLSPLTPVPSGATSAVAPDPNLEATAAPVVAAVQPAAPMFDEHFTANDAGWPSSPDGAALIANGTYTISTRQAGQFAAVGVPVANVPDDAVISATFLKLAGPAGGGYGIIIRDQETGLRDGSSQDGQYYVLEAGDRGEVGIWRRDGDHWVDLLPWQHSDAVKTGTATNELTVRAVGHTLSLMVNGTQVATRTDNTLTSGRAGLFVGGDGNQVAVSRYTIQAP